MPDDLRLYLEWSKSYQIKLADNIKLDNPYAGKYLFKASYVNEPRPDMSRLLNWDYGRIWKREHIQYITKRTNKATPKRFKPDIYYRRRLLQRNIPNEPKLLIRSKKYEQIKKKINNGT